MRRFRESMLWALPWMLGGGLMVREARAQAPEPHPTPTAPSPAAASSDATAKVDEVPRDLLRPTEGGLTAVQAGDRAAETSYSAKAQLQALRSAAARVDEALAAFLPRLTGIAAYTRLSPITPPSFSTLITPPTAATLPSTCTLTNGCVAALQVIGKEFSSAAFPVYVDNGLLQATLVVPISDYFLRINHNYTAATRSRDAARYDAEAAKAAAAADGRAAFYAWLGSRGSLIVAAQALADQKSHYVQAKHLFEAGQASKSDELRARTNVAGAEQLVAHAKNLSDLAEKQLRIAMHARDDEVLTPGESLEVNPVAVASELRPFIDEGIGARLEVKSIDANAEAARQQAKAAFASQLPVVSGGADAIYSNPNARLFPPAQEWYATWDVGVRVTWSPNDTWMGGSNVTDLKARAAELDAQKGALRDRVELEVTQAYNNARESDVSLESAKTELESAEEAYRVTKELFSNGRATSTTLTDSETELTRARLDLLTARVNARTARVRLDHALGRDVKPASADGK
jgi:outer membrane protein TolC